MRMGWTEMHRLPASSLLFSSACFHLPSSGRSRKRGKSICYFLGEESERKMGLWPWRGTIRDFNAFGPDWE